MPPFDREKFNTDPKHEGERTQFDQMVEDSVKRIAAKNKPNDPPKKDDFLSGFLDGLFNKGG